MDVGVRDCERVQTNWFRLRAGRDGGSSWSDGPLLWTDGITWWLHLR